MAPLVLKVKCSRFSGCQGQGSRRVPFCYPEQAPAPASPRPFSLTSEPAQEKIVILIWQGGQHILDILPKL